MRLQTQRDNERVELACHRHEHLRTLNLKVHGHKREYSFAVTKLPLLQGTLTLSLPSCLDILLNKCPRKLIKQAYLECRSISLFVLYIKW